MSCEIAVPIVSSVNIFQYVAWQISRNTGVAFIPEMRLTMAIITVILGTAGLDLFGTAAQNHYPWIGDSGPILIVSL